MEIATQIIRSLALPLRWLWAANFNSPIRSFVRSACSLVRSAARSSSLFHSHFTGTLTHREGEQASEHQQQQAGTEARRGRKCAKLFAVCVFWLRSPVASTMVWTSCCCCCCRCLSLGKAFPLFVRSEQPARPIRAVRRDGSGSAQRIEFCIDPLSQTASPWSSLARTHQHSASRRLLASRWGATASCAQKASAAKTVVAANVYCSKATPRHQPDPKGRAFTNTAEPLVLPLQPPPPQQQQRQQQTLTAERAG